MLGVTHSLKVVVGGSKEYVWIWGLGWDLQIREGCQSWDSNQPLSMPSSDEGWWAL